MKRKPLVILGVLVVAGLVVAGLLYVIFPIPMTTYGGMGLNFVKSLNAPAGTLSVETNAAYKAPAPIASASPPTDPVWPALPPGTGRSYNRTPSSQRFSPLTQINTKNVANLKVLCTYDLHTMTAFESGLIMVDNALIGTTEYEIFSINPATCAENWRTKVNSLGSLLPANRGAAYMDGMLFRGTQDGRVLAFDFKTGKQLWDTTIADPKHGESVPAAPLPGTV
jgi:alcohol dehydrogenase (cytochrome c)